ncbi:hypothetical protein [Lysinibacillus sp. LZ02]|uniref:hypothetical protein n=1 Tax=Lysinibacillus sp. LZ02 TaxID=3420668 RepID=UPI003D36A45C
MIKLNLTQAFSSLCPKKLAVSEHNGTLYEQHQSARAKTCRIRAKKRRIPA